MVRGTLYAKTERFIKNINIQSGEFRNSNEQSNNTAERLNYIKKNQGEVTTL